MDDQMYSPRQFRLKIRRHLHTPNTCPKCYGWKEEKEKLCADCEFDRKMRLLDKIGKNRKGLRTEKLVRKE